SGLVLVWKQLQQNAFRWPPVMDGVMRLSAVEFAALFDGLDWTVCRQQRGFRNPSSLRRIRCVAHADKVTGIPTDAHALHALVLSMTSELEAVKSERNALTAERDGLLERLERQQNLLLKLSRMQFGRKSERLPEDQLQLGLEDTEQAIAKANAEAE